MDIQLKPNISQLFMAISKRLTGYLLFVLILAGCRGQISVPMATGTEAAILQDQVAEPSVTNIPQPVATLETKEVEPMGIYEINNRLGRGVNFGNALEAPSEGEWGVILEAKYFELIAAQGFDSVRIPIRWSAHAALTSPFAIDPTFFDRVDWAVTNALEQDLAVMINFHHYEEIFSDPQAQEERFLELWRQVADHYKDAPAELVFEILNEPHDQLDAAAWNKLLVKSLAIIRETNPVRAVVVGPADWNNLYALESLDLPQDDPNLIVTFHYYLPFKFTHQGSEWNPGSDEWMGTTWEASEAQKQAIVKDMDRVASWAKRQNRPVYLGEFGAYSKADIDSRARWTAFVAQSAWERGFSWAYWEFCAGFGIYDPVLGIWIEPLVSALLPVE